MSLVGTGTTASAVDRPGADLSLDLAMVGQNSPHRTPRTAKAGRWAPPPADVPAGGTATYTLEVLNAGPSDSADVTVTDTLPADLEFVSSPDCQASGVDNRTITCTSTTPLVVGATRSFTVVVRVKSGTADGTTVVNNAAASSTTTDPTPGNNGDTATINVKALTDMTVVKTAPSAAVIAGGAEFDITLQAVNNGPSDAAAVTVTDALDIARFDFVATGTDPRCTFASPTITCTFGTVTAGASPSAIVKLRAKASTTPGSHPNTATVATTTPESDPDNNSSTAQIPVTTSADLSLKKTVVATTP